LSGRETRPRAKVDELRSLPRELRHDGRDH
jgi:hypothetical protein